MWPHDKNGSAKIIFAVAVGVTGVEVVAQLPAHIAGTLCPGAFQQRCEARPAGPRQSPDAPEIKFQSIVSSTAPGTL